MISHKHKCVFVHIPKCAGRSVEAAFLKDNNISNRNSMDCHNVLEITPDGLSEKDKKELGVGRQEDLDHKLLSNYNIPEGYMTFTITRDPISRAVSYYTWYGHTQYNTFLKFCQSLFSDNWWEYMMTRPQTDYVTGGVLDNIIDIKDASEFIKSTFNIELPHNNKSKLKSKDVNICSQSLNILRNVYRDDFNFLDYE